MVTTNSVSLLKSTSCSNNHTITSSKSLRCAAYSEEKCSKYILFFFGADCKKFLYPFLTALSPSFPAPLQKMHRCKNRTCQRCPCGGKGKEAHAKACASCLCWHLPIVPGRFQPSIVGTSELNCRVRDGNGCTLTVINTNCYPIHSTPVLSTALFSAWTFKTG